MGLGGVIHHNGAGQKHSGIFCIPGATRFAVSAQVIKFAGSKSNPDGVFCAGIKTVPQAVPADPVQP